MLNNLIRRFKQYNQGLNPFTVNFCSGYNIFHVIQLQWDIIVSNDYIVKTAKLAEKQGVYSLTNGAYFSKMYQFFVDEIKKKFDIELKVITKSVYSDDFEKLLKEGYSFGIGLKFVGRWWRGAKKDHKILLSEANVDIDGFKVIGHALTYSYSKKKDKYYITDSASTRKPVEMDIEVLRAAVDSGIFFSNARTLYMKDRLLDKALKDYRDGIKIENVEDLSEAEQKAIYRASKLRVFNK